MQASGGSRVRWAVPGRFVPGLALLALLAAPAALRAQPVVQALPGGNTQSLNAALARLARDPRDLSALIDAGNAALQMGDVDAATGFFARADQLSPNNMRVRAGLAAALVRSENPFDAIPLFAEAEKAGALEPMLESDRGLAYDLVGDNASAQRYYRKSLAAQTSDETLRRLALSQAIAGDRAGMELTLAPLLQKQDKAAWRTRAFALAILNRPEDAVAIANQTMPTELAGGIAPYLRYMPRLTAAQQAAAANFGRFPRAAEIGRDDPRVALYAPPKRVATADAGLVPAGEPLGKGRARSSAAASRVAVAAPVAPAARSAPPDITPDRQVSAAPQLVVATAPEPRPAASSAPVPLGVRVPVFAPVPPAPAAAPPAVRPAPLAAAQAVSAPMPRAGAPVAAAPVASAPPSPAPAFPSGFDLARVVAAQGASPPPVAALPPTAAPAPAPAPVTAPPAPRPAPAPAARPARVADAFGDFKVPTGSVAPAPGAVDVRKIAAARPRPPEPPKAPPKPLHPSRIWVQVGTGRDVKALAFTWKDLARENPELLRGKSAWMSDWGRTNRLLTGPFPSESAAQSFLARLKKAGLDAFEWTSPAGQVVDDLPGT